MTGLAAKFWHASGVAGVGGQPLPPCRSNANFGRGVAIKLPDEHSWKTSGNPPRRATRRDKVRQRIGYRTKRNRGPKEYGRANEIQPDTDDSNVEDRTA